MYEVWYSFSSCSPGYIVVYEINGQKVYQEEPEFDPFPFDEDLEYTGSYQLATFSTKEEAFAFIDAKHDMEEERFNKLRERIEMRENKHEQIH